MKYFKQLNDSIVIFEPAFVTNAEGKEVQVTFSNGKEVTKADYDKQEETRTIRRLTEKTEAANLAEDKAIEREAIDEIIREQFSKEIAARVKEKKSKRQNAK
jgi:hypothetical protein